jgi:peptidoglycan/xylan/chitin deacetylase (PgdA/CDA1 family)
MIKKHNIFFYFIPIIIAALLLIFPIFHGEFEESRNNWNERQFYYWTLATSKIKAEELARTKYLAEIEKQKEISKLYEPKVYFFKENSNKEIAITIDDCYSYKDLAAIYELSKKYNVRFTFFPIGTTIKSNATILKKLLDVGNEIELHGYYHQSVLKLKTETNIFNNYNDEITAMKKYVNSNLVFHYIRPPYGEGVFNYTKTKLGMYTPLFDAIKKININNQLTMNVAMWDADHFSSIQGVKLSNKKNIIINYFKEKLPTRTIFLFHTTDADTSALEEVIKYALSKDYKLVTLYQLEKEESYNFDK